MDLLTLAEDIQHNHFLQDHGHKGRFYYTFSPKLHYQQPIRTKADKIKMIKKLVRKGALVEYVEKTPTARTPDELKSSNTHQYKDATVLLRVAPVQLAELIRSLQPYRQAIMDAEKPILPPIRIEVTKDFIIHENDLVSYRGRLIDLEPQASQIAIHIMERSKQGLFTATKSIIDNCLSEKYLERIASTQDEERPYKYVRRRISEIRKIFRTATRTDSNYFVSQGNKGYIFKLD